jgi:hypothetical protein
MTEPEAADTPEVVYPPPVQLPAPQYATTDAAEEADEIAILKRVAYELASTDFVAQGIRGRKEMVFAAVLQGRALGVDPITSLREISLIGGKPYLSATLQHALVRRAGHSITGTSDAKQAVVEGQRSDTNEKATVTYTLEQAIDEGLVEVDAEGKPRARSREGKPLPWERFTEQMLWHRAVTRLVNRLFPEVVVGRL